MDCPNDILIMWESVKAELKASVSEPFFNVWYANIKPSSYFEEDNTLLFSASSDFIAKILTEKHTEVISNKFKDLFDITFNITFRGEGTQNNESPISIKRQNNTPEETFQKNAAPIKNGAELAQRSRYTFENFIVGETNKYARTACWTVANNPSHEWNPLFIHGPSGVGKTHLMYAVINEIMRKRPDVRVIYTKGDEFVNYMIECMSHQAMNKFRDRYRQCDVLLVDDIQFIAGKVATQEEFFNTFNTLFDEGKQIILASDRPPRDINPLEERLRSRFEQGLLADICLPDLELRVAILKKKAEDMNIDLPDEVLSFLSENLRSNIRQIEGALKKLSAQSLLDGRNITLEFTKNCVSDLLGDTEPIDVTIDKIFTAIFKKYNVSKELILGKQRTKHIANARHIAIYLIREITEMSLPNIAKIFDKNHTTILNSSEVISKRMMSDLMLAQEIDNLKKEILG